MMAEKRMADRTDPMVCIDALFRALRDHMDNEELQNREHELQRQNDMKEIKNLLSPLDKIMESMPRDAHGNPSTFLHRVQHEEQSSVHKYAGRIRNGFLAKAGELLLIGIIVLAANGHLGSMLGKLLG